MHTLIAFLSKHEVWTALISYWFFSAAVSSLPTPNGSGKFYKWFYTFTNKFAGNVFSAIGDKIPNLVQQNTQIIAPNTLKP
jgi:hypothetical protein